MIVEPARLALTTTPSIAPSSAEVALPASVCAKVGDAHKAAAATPSINEARIAGIFLDMAFLPGSNAVLFQPGLSTQPRGDASLARALFQAGGPGAASAATA